MTTLLNDIRFAFRTLRKSPGFAAVAILTLALGIGANTAIFSVVDAVLLKPLPYPEPARIVAIWAARVARGETHRALSYPDFADLRAQSDVYDAVAAYSDDTTTLTGSGEPLHLNKEDVSAEMFTVLGIHPMLGRAFLPGEDLPAHNVAILDAKLWQSHFGGDPGVIGRSISLLGRDYIVVGVLPPTFEFPFNSVGPQVFTTFSQAMTPERPGDKPMVAERSAHFLRGIARLKPGVTLAQANAQADAIGQRLAAQYPDSNKSQSFEVESGIDTLVGTLRPQLYILLGAVVFVLLIGCANIANLLLARATIRQREMAIRAALGAGRARIVRQLLIESGMISLAGGAAGLVVAAWGAAYLSKLAASEFPRVAGTAVDLRVLAFTFGASLLTGLLFGIAPALLLSRQAPGEMLKEGGRSSTQSTGQHRMRGLLIVCETSLAVMLLASAGLLIESLANLRRVNPGFEPRGVTTFNLDLLGSRYVSVEQHERFYEQVLDRVRAIPGVQSAAMAAPLPFSDSSIGVSFFIQGKPVAESDKPYARCFIVSTGYFATMKQPLLKGRDFAETDRANSQPVIIIDQAFADKFFPGENPVGQHMTGEIAVEGDPPVREVIGVVNAIHARYLAKPPEPAYYIPENQLGIDWQYGVVRSNENLATLIPEFREAVRAVDTDTPVYSTFTMEDSIARSITQPRLDSALLGLFAALALVLAMVGIYGVMSYGVAQRTNEIGIRMTLGAQPGDVLRLVMRQGLMVAGAGALIGVIASIGATRLLASLLFGVAPGDPLTLAGVVILFAAVAALACWLPARRAMHVDPMVALRYE